ncbi:MAG: TIGR01244 family sulfur transferase [Pseudomonadota bacterium]
MMKTRPFAIKPRRLLAPFLGLALAISIVITADATSLKETAMSDKFKPVSETFLVAPQLSPADIKDAAAMGVTLIVNNRPDGEAPGQPTHAELEAAAKQAGIAYAYLPVDARGITPAHTGGLEDAIDDAEDGATLAFCRSGMRSILVWSYAEARFGKPVDQIIDEARAAGFDISGHEPALTLLHDAHKAPRTHPPV